ncbi:MAG: hypothetical protein QW318_07115 [Candidatus Caldarchaeum sp.]
MTAQQLKALERLSYVGLCMSFIISVIMLFSQTTTQEIRGAIWAVWGIQGVAVIFGFWFKAAFGTVQKSASEEIGEAS